MPQVRILARNKSGFLGKGLGILEPGDTVLLVPTVAAEDMIVEAIKRALEERKITVHIKYDYELVGLTKQLAITHAEQGITINAIGPGAIPTGLRANTVRILGTDAPVMRGVGGDDAAVRAITPAGRRGTVEEVAAIAMFLASREASYVTGNTLMVDGGWIAR